MATTLVVVRHAETTWNAERRWAGHADPPLSPLGVQQAEALARAHATAVDRVAASDLHRALATAEAVRAAGDLPPIVVEPRLRERFLGIWEGRTSMEIDVEWPGLLDELRTGRLDQPPEGEAWSPFVARVEAGLAALASVDGTTLVVTHGGVFRAVESLYGLPFRRMTNATGVRLTFDAAGAVEASPV